MLKSVVFLSDLVFPVCWFEKKKKLKSQNKQNKINMADLISIFFLPFLQNYPIILTATATCFAFQHLSFVLAALNFPSFVLLKKESQLDFSVRCVAILHCLSSFFTVRGYLFPTGEISTDLYVPDPYAHFFYCLTTGYFLWDIFVSIYYRWGPGFICHAFLSFGVFYFGLYPFCQFDMRYFHGVFEISTIFLHLREVLPLIGKENSIFYKLFGATFAVTFFLIRIVFGFKTSYESWIKVLNLFSQGTYHSSFVLTYFLVANGILMSLQVYWFFLLLKNIFGHTSVAEENLDARGNELPPDQKKKKN